MPNPKFRGGLTLAEVLISLLVLSLGLMGILALYPLGARQMANAIKDERSAQLADIGDGMAHIYWRSAWLNPDGSLASDAQALASCPELASLDSAIITKTSSRASCPMYIDPIGAPNSLGGASVVPATSITFGVPSTSLNVGQKLRFFGLLDDISFNTNTGLANPVNRGSRYNSGWLLQRPKNNVRHEVNLKVVVYQNRSPDSPTPPTATGNVTATAGSEFITIATAAQPFRVGGWIMLAAQPTAAVDGFADFYRVVAITTSAIRVAPPIRRTTTTVPIQILQDVVEVFDRGTITPFEAPGN